MKASQFLKILKRERRGRKCWPGHQDKSPNLDLELSSRGTALNSGSVYASHPAVLGSNPGDA